MARPIASIDIDLRVDEALESIEKLKYEVINYSKSLPKVSNEMEAMANRSNTALSKIGKAWDKIKLKAKDFNATLGKIVSKMKYMGLAAFGLAVGTAKGATQTSNEGKMLGLGYAGQKGVESANKFTGFNPNLGGLQDALSEGYYSLDLAKLGLNADELLKMDGVKSYFKVFDTLGAKLDELINEAGGDTTQGLSNFNAIYGDVLGNMLGLSPRELQNIRSGGIDKQWQGKYAQTAGMYANVDVKKLQEADALFDKFWTKLKAVFAELAGPLLTPLTKALDSLMKMAKTMENSKFFKTSMDAFVKAMDTLANVFESLFKILDLFTQGKVGEALDVAKKELMKPLDNAVKNVAEKAVNTLYEVAEFDPKKGIWDNTKEKASQAGERAKDTLKGYFDNIFGTSHAKNDILEEIQKIIDNPYLGNSNERFKMEMKALQDALKNNKINVEQTREVLQGKTTLDKLGILTINFQENGKPVKQITHNVGTNSYVQMGSASAAQ